MGWPEAITEGLPPPHESEPSNLRRDIVDELADHLAMAMQRELRRNEDEHVARRAVLNRFGDPSALARRLWWDAMKETIMRDRLMLIGVAVVLVAVLAFLGVSWAAQSRINQAILAKLEGLSARPSAPAVPENWSVIAVKVVEGNKDGPPVVGETVTLSGRAFNDQPSGESIEENTDAQGLVRFGPVRPGKYFIMINREQMRTEEVVVLYPGAEREHLIVCPDTRPATVSFKLVFTEGGGMAASRPANVPPDAMVQFVFSGSYRAGDTTNWRTADWLVTVAMDGRIMESQSSRSLGLPMTMSFKDAKSQAHIELPPADYHVRFVRLMVQTSGIVGGIQDPWTEGAQWRDGMGGPVMRFETHPGERSEWVVHLPEAMMKNYEQNMKAHGRIGSASRPSTSAPARQ